MRRSLLFIFCCAVSTLTWAQVNVTATSATPGPSNYTTLKSAFDAINIGIHQGAITIKITGNTTESATALLNASGQGAALYTSIAIQPDGGAFTITGDLNAPLISLDGADNISINGLNAGGNALTLVNTNTGTDITNSTIRLVNDASSNSFQQLAILGAGSVATTGVLLFSPGTTTGNDGNSITNCNIADAATGFPVNAIYSVSTAGAENSGNIVSNNNIYNYFSAALSSSAITLSTANSDWTINTNRFFQTATRTYTAGNPHRAIYITSGNNYSITGNIIGHASAAGSGIYTMAGSVTSRFLAIDVAAGTVTPSVISNNRISDMSFLTSNNASSSTGIWCAINVSAGNVTVTGNTIGSTAGTGNITILPQVGGTLTVPITVSSTGAVNITGNIIGSIDVLPAAALSGNMTGIWAQAAAGTINITNNIIGNTTAHNMKIGALGTTTGNGTIRGVINQSTGSVNITGNTIRNLTHYSSNVLATFRAIEMQNGTGNISDNTITSITANGVSTTLATPEGAGILVTSSVANLNIENNTINGLNVINTTTGGLILYGIYLSSNSNNYTISRNRIYNLSNASTSVSTSAPGIMAGIYLRDGVAGTSTTVVNNMISLGNGQSTNTAIIGIWNSINSSNGSTARIWYNTVNIEGTVASGAQPSFCYMRGDFNATAYNGPVVDIRNNIFTNTRSGGTGKHYAIANSYAATTSSSTGWAANASNYNVLNAAPSTVGYWSGDLTFAAWQAAAASDANSYSGITVVYQNSASDLHLVPSANYDINAKATPIATVTTDIDNDVRDATMPDIGADEFAAVFPVDMEYFKGANNGNSNVLQWKATCSAATVIFEVQHSTNGKDFTVAGMMNATRERCALPFDFTHPDPSQGVNYYRLRMTEADGKVTYSGIIAILNKTISFKVIGLYPQQVRNEAVLNLSSSKSDKITVRVLDAAGKQMQQQVYGVTSGSNNIRLKLDQLAAGIYTLAVYNATGALSTVRFVKQ